MPWINGEWWDSLDIRPDVESDRVGAPRPTGVLGPNGQELHRIEPVGFNQRSRLVYVRKRSRQDHSE